jgi:membrane protein
MWQRFQAHDVPGLGAELAYRFLFAIFPFGLFVAALAAFIATWLRIDNPTGQILAALGDNLPPDIANSLRPELEGVINTTRPGLLSIGAIAALWAATGGTNALMKGMNRAYDLEETRPIHVRYAIAVGLTLLACLGVLASFVTVVGGSLLTQQIANQLGVGAQAWMVLQVLRWPLVFVLLVMATSILYRYAPNIAAPWRAILTGATAFAVGWLLATFAFAIYVANFSSYGATYGSLGSVIVLMIWFYLTAVLMVTGAELVAVLTRAMDPSRIRARQGQIRLLQDARESATTQSGSRDAVARDRRLALAAEPGALLSAPGPAALLPSRRPPDRDHGTPPFLIAGVTSAVVAGLALLLARTRPR